MISAINVGIVGLGRMGHRHIEAVKKMGMNVCGIVDNSTVALSETAHKFNINEDCCFQDAEQMLRLKIPQAVVIATTAPSHAAYTVLSAHNKVNYILCEKPMALSLEESNSMIETCNDFGVKLAINHQMMFLPQYTEIKKMINSERMGPLSSILVSGSNFGLAMNASHYFEMFRFLTNTEITSVQAWFESEKVPNPRGAEFEDYSGSLLAKNSLGIRMYIDFSANAGHGLNVVYIFKYGQVIVDELSGFVRSICRKEEYQALPTTRYGMPDNINHYEIKPFEMIDSTILVWNGLLSSGVFPDDKVGMHAMKCLVAAFESHENNNIAVAIDKIAIDKSKKFKWA